MNEKKETFQQHRHILKQREDKVKQSTFFTSLTQLSIKKKFTLRKQLKQLKLFLTSIVSTPVLKNALVSFNNLTRILHFKILVFQSSSGPTAR